MKNFQKINSEINTLLKGIFFIENKFNAKVEFIEMEDGSGNCFNYRLSGETEIKFIRIN